MSLGKIVAGLTAGAAAFALVAAQPPAPRRSVEAPPLPAVEPAPLPDPVKAADPLGAMLSDAKSAYGKLRDYTCTFARQERVKEVLGLEQLAEMKVRVKPFSVAVRFAKPDAVAGMEERYVAGMRFDKVKYRPAGAKGANGFQLVSLDDPKILAETRHPMTELGIGATIDRLISIAAREKTLGNALEVFTSDFQFGGKNVTRFEIFAKRAHAHRYAYRMLVYVDKESKLPVRFEAYGEAKPGTIAGDLLESYSYSDVKFNVGLGENAFE
jgi:hypothetical protein